jgi:hypothetical protein
MVKIFVQDFFKKNLTMQEFFGRIGALRKLARRQIVVNRQNSQKSYGKTVKNAQK